MLHARLFDHRPIVQGHINYFVKEFEVCIPCYIASIIQAQWNGGRGRGRRGIAQARDLANKTVSTWEKTACIPHILISLIYLFKLV